MRSQLTLLISFCGGKCTRGQVCMIADGQVTMGTVRSKGSGVKVRRVSNGNHHVVIGFAGTAVDCLTLFDLLEEKIKAHPNLLAKACVELALLWCVCPICGRESCSFVYPFCCLSNPQRFFFWVQEKG